ncbi:hypothetical protein SNEBB_000199 [Seison nebaliae]|nr:hypothetical protein SNEBB_000199 [Seison nebaliae]
MEWLRMNWIDLGVNTRGEHIIHNSQNRRYSKTSNTIPSIGGKCTTSSDNACKKNINIQISKLLGSGLIQIPQTVYNKPLLKESLQHAYYDLVRFEDNKIECVANCEQLLSDAIALPINNQHK